MDHKICMCRSGSIIIREDPLSRIPCLDIKNTPTLAKQLVHGGIHFWNGVRTLNLDSDVKARCTLASLRTFCYVYPFLPGKTQSYHRSSYAYLYPTVADLERSSKASIVPWPYNDRLIASSPNDGLKFLAVSCCHSSERYNGAAPA
jgi:hypothetical protein